MSLLDRFHSEDVKAILRKRYRSVAAFERAEGLARQSVTEILRGRPSARTRKAVERVIRDHLKSVESIVSVDSAAGTPAHRLNAGAR
jgi:lambda repressor-like predicted transcriptional regulator